MKFFIILLVVIHAFGVSCTIYFSILLYLFEKCLIFMFKYVFYLQVYMHSYFAFNYMYEFTLCMSYLLLQSPISDQVGTIEVLRDGFNGNIDCQVSISVNYTPCDRNPTVECSIDCPILQGSDVRLYS